METRDQMSVKLTSQEIDDFLRTANTLIISTIRKSGEPLMTPIWYVWMDEAFLVRTGADSAKVQHIRRDPRACCLVEEGEAWVDLRAVVANCDVAIVHDPDTISRFQIAFDKKYAKSRPERASLPSSTQSHYGSDRVVLRFTPRDGELRSWYNRKIRMKPPA